MSINVITEIESAITDIKNLINKGASIPGVSFRDRGIQVMKFPAHLSSNYNNHSKLLDDLSQKNLISDYKVTKIDLNGKNGLAGLIIITGSSNSIAEFAGKVYYLREAEKFVAENLGNDWNKINAESTISDTPSPSMGLDLSGAESSFKELLEIIKNNT